MWSCEVTTCILHQNIFYINTRIFNSNFTSIGSIGSMQPQGGYKNQAAAVFCFISMYPNLTLLNSTYSAVLVGSCLFGTI